MRVAALRDIGFYQGHLTEDLATGMRFHVGRWESVYVPEPLAVGEGPTTWAAYFNQQYRWAFGCMNIFFTTHWPKVNLRMRITHAIYYFLMEQFYFSGLTMATAVLLIMIYWLQRFNIRPKLERGFLWAGRLLTITVIPIYLLALVVWGGVTAVLLLVFSVPRLCRRLAGALRWERAGLGQPKSVS